MFKSYLLGLPPQCKNYNILNEASRNRNNSLNVPTYCDKDAGFSGSVWYRMMPPAGIIIPEDIVPKKMCGTNAPGWMNGAHPISRGEEVERQICFNWNGNSCNWQNNIKVTNCDSYYVYKLQPPSSCYLRYCADFSSPDPAPGKYLVYPGYV